MINAGMLIISIALSGLKRIFQVVELPKFKQ